MSGYAGTLSWNSLPEALKMSGKVRDPLHDTIPFTEAEKIIINEPEFQRLRRILQTAFLKYVFPGATHTRFEHSLGVMHIAGIMLANLISNQRRLLTELDTALDALPPLIQNSFSLTEHHHGSLRETKKGLGHLQSGYIAQCLRFAALLHDIGHAPFSHSGERFNPTWKQFEESYPNLNIPTFLKDAFAKKCADVKRKFPFYQEIRIRHEIYTLLGVVKLFQKSGEYLNPEMGQDICAVIDTSVEPCPGGELERSGLRNLLHEIVSGELDVDRMDYLLRDAKQCGVIYGIFDAGRLLDSAAFYYDIRENKYHLALRRSGVAAFEDYLRARWSMYQQVYFHKTSTACEAMLEAIHKQLGRFSFPLELDEFLKLDDHSFFHYVSSLPSSPKGYGLDVLKDLLYNRRLWKRVYEEITPLTAATATPSLCPATMMFLRSQQVPAETIESGTSLTRFTPKGRQSQSSNSLKVIVKDVHRLRFLEPIENHSRLVNRLDEETLVRRIYVSRYKESGEEICASHIQQLVSSQVVTPKVD